MPEVQDLNHRHHGILRWLLANPGKPLTVCAYELGYTLPWLSTIIHSHAFQEELRAAQGELTGDLALGIKDKLVGLAHLSLDKLIETVPVSSDPKFILDAGREALRNLGYTPERRGGGVYVQVNTGAVSPDELARARAMVMKGETPALEPPHTVPSDEAA